MPRPMPDGYLFAFAETWPFRSDVAILEQTIALRRTSALLLDGSTQRLADALENELRVRAAGPSLHVLESLRDDAWFSGVGEQKCSLLDLLLRIAVRSVDPCGDRAALRPDGDFCARLEQQRWLSLLLPTDLIVAARYALDPAQLPTSDRVSLVTPSLAAMLQGAPVAETHLHLGAAIPFELVWTGLTGWLRVKDAAKVLKQGLQHESLLPFGSAQSAVAMLICGLTGRLLMASFLWHRDRSESGQQRTFSDFLPEHLTTLAGALGSAAGFACDRQTIEAMLWALICGSPPERLSLVVLAKLYRRLAAPVISGLAGTLEELVQQDPLARWCRYSDGTALPETQFLARALSYLQGAQESDALFTRAFWQYTRVRNKLFAHLTLQPGTAGLDWFTRHYDRIRVFRRPFEKVQFSIALRAASRDVRLGSLEGRTAPEARWCDVRDELRRVASQAEQHLAGPGEPRPEVGMILHFIKEAKGIRRGEPFLHSDPRQKAHGVRFGAWGHARLRQARAVARALRHNPELLLVLRGIDVAALELSVPTWPLVRLFDVLRQASSSAANVLARRWPWVRATPLRVTCHAGEDYSRLVEGLRRVHELIDFGILRAGDRIGHGLSLGDPPDQWARRSSVVRQPREERLDDLLWEIERSTKGDFDCGAGRLAFVREEAQRLGEEIYQQDQSVEDLCRARRLRHDWRELERVGYPFLRVRAGGSVGTGGRRADGLLVSYLTGAGVFARGRQPVEVRVTEGEVKFLRNAQNWLRRQLAAREVTIESNPSSNLLIGDLRNLRDHPSFRLQPLDGVTSEEDASGNVALPLSINTDDPICFATSLADEYAYLYASLLREGVGSASALAWLDARRRDGHRSRFTLAASAVSEVLSFVATGRVPMR